MSLRTISRSSTSAASRALEERLEHYVHERTDGMVRDLAVEVEEDGVSILGRSRSYYIKQLATHAVIDAVSGMTLRNKIEVVE